MQTMGGLFPPWGVVDTYNIIHSFPVTLGACTEVAVGRASRTGTEGRAVAGYGRILLFPPFSTVFGPFPPFFPKYFCVRGQNFPRSRGDWPTKFPKGEVARGRAGVEAPWVCTEVAVSRAGTGEGSRGVARAVEEVARVTEGFHFLVNILQQNAPRGGNT